MKVYIGEGRARLACPRAADEPGHSEAVGFVWQDGSEHAEHHQAELRCPCGEALVHQGGRDPFTHPFREVTGTPHDPGRP